MDPRQSIILSISELKFSVSKHEQNLFMVECTIWENSGLGKITYHKLLRDQEESTNLFGVFTVEDIVEQITLMLMLILKRISVTN